MKSGKMDKAVVMVGMSSSRPVVSMMELGVEIDWSQVESESESFCLGGSSKRFLNLDV